MALSDRGAACRDRDVLPAADGVADRIPFDRTVERSLPENPGGSHVERAELPIQIPGKHQAARRRQHRAHRRALIVGPSSSPVEARTAASRPTSPFEPGIGSMRSQLKPESAS